MRIRGAKQKLANSVYNEDASAIPSDLSRRVGTRAWHEARETDQTNSKPTGHPGAATGNCGVGERWRRRVAESAVQRRNTCILKPQAPGLTASWVNTTVRHSPALAKGILTVAPEAPSRPSFLSALLWAAKYVRLQTERLNLSIRGPVAAMASMASLLTVFLAATSVYAALDVDLDSAGEFNLAAEMLGCDLTTPLCTAQIRSSWLPSRWPRTS